MRYTLQDHDARLGEQRSHHKAMVYALYVQADRLTSDVAALHAAIAALTDDKDKPLPLVARNQNEL